MLPLHHWPLFIKNLWLFGICNSFTPNKLWLISGMATRQRELGPAPARCARLRHLLNPTLRIPALRHYSPSLSETGALSMNSSLPCRSTPLFACITNLNVIDPLHYIIGMRYTFLLPTSLGTLAFQPWGSHRHLQTPPYIDIVSFSPQNLVAIILYMQVHIESVTECYLGAVTTS